MSSRVRVITPAVDVSGIGSDRKRARERLGLKEGQFAIDLQDEIVKGALLVHEGKVVHEMIKPLLEEQGT